VDEEDLELARFVLWSVFAAATQTVADDTDAASAAADALLDAAQERFPFLKPKPIDPLDLV